MSKAGKPSKADRQQRQQQGQRQQNQQPQQANTQGRGVFLGVIGAIALVGVVLVAAAVFSRSQQSQVTTTTSSRPNVEFSFSDQNGQRQKLRGIAVDADLLTGARFVLGQASAKATIVEFASYGCHVCKDFAEKDKNKLVSELVDSGRAKLIFRDYQITGGNDPKTNERVAVAAACSNKQDESAFWKFHDVIFRAQAEWRNLSGDTLDSKLGDYANQLGIDTNALKSCMSESKDMVAAIESDRKLGDQAGISGTPAFVVNGYRWSTFIGDQWREGSMPAEYFKAIVDYFEKKSQ
jgi:protein-disulfide isomerase